ncbi:hypothetical protein [Stella sp.]|uniref:hypothetical protein n=1 Tax=Stella sp. TaxID=2912054 RepID=UPI0035B18061
MTARALALLLLAALLWGHAAPAGAQALILPPDRRADLLRQIDDACPECRMKGFVPCGGPRLGPGPAFAPAALQGSPRRGYLVGFVMGAAEFRNAVRGTPMTPLVDGLERRFARARLLVFEDRFARVRVLEQSPRVAVTVPVPLHACLADPARSWGCCSGRGCGGECCEKGLGSPSVALTWVDVAGGEELRFEFRHGPGEARLIRRSGGRRTTYFCATDRRYGLG